MSVVECEAHIVVDGPLPRERVHTLLTVPGVVVGKEAHWENGILSFGYPEDVPHFWEDSLAGTFRVKDEGDGFPQGTFTSFTLYVPVSCTAAGMPAAEFAEKAGRVLEVTQAYGVELALAAGVTGLSNPFLSDNNMTPLASSSAVSARVGVSYLEEAIAATARGGMIHVTPAVADALQPIRVTDDPTVPLYTGAGTPVAVGAGYSGITPVGESAPDTTEDWIYASGPVEVRIDDTVSLPEFNEAIDWANNDVTYRAEKTAVVSWDTALQAGVLVDWAL